MKKYIFLLVFATATLLYAQDIIVTTDAQKIDAKILEVSKTEIKYKEITNLDGPIFVLPTEDINSIIYSNGKVSIYNTNQIKQQEKIISTEQTQTASKESINKMSATILLLNEDSIKTEIIEFNDNSVTYLNNEKSYTIPASQISSITFSNGQVKTYNKVKPYNSEKMAAYSDEGVLLIERDDNGHIFFGGETISYDQYISLLQENCASAWGSYNTGRKLEKAGVISMSVGSVLTAIGLSCVIGGGATDNTGAYITGLVISSIGEPILVAGIPLYMVGTFKKRNAYETYNDECARKKLTLNVHTYYNGIGLALKF